jgi:hypothetical protein
MITLITRSLGSIIPLGRIVPLTLSSLHKGAGYGIFRRQKAKPRNGQEVVRTHIRFIFNTDLTGKGHTKTVIPVRLGKEVGK